MRGGDMTNGLLDMISNLGDTSNMTMIEIGSYIGESTILFAEKFKNVISIDPFLESYDEVPLDNMVNSEIIYNKFLENISKYNNIVHIKKTSCDAFEDIQEKVDFVYIDGLHAYEQVKKDIYNYRKIIKEGGTIAGHDYSKGWIGVMNAVNESLGLPDKVFSDYSWIKKL
jgi:predicted O-methyltransferase YrrM